MLLSLILYGSRARGDHRHTSDVDLLGVVDQATIRHEPAIRGTNLHLYPFDTLLTKSKSGDLFALHLVEEGRTLHDTAGVFERVKENFTYRDNYQSDIQTATAVAYYLLSQGTLLQKRRARARLIWAVRTLLIARAAELRKPVFSSAALENFSGVRSLKESIDKKYVVSVERLVGTVTAILEKFGTGCLPVGWPHDKRQQGKFLAQLSPIGRSTVDLAAKPNFKNGVTTSIDDYPF